MAAAAADVEEGQEKPMTLPDELLECPVCMSLPLGHIYICSMGHSICGDCFGKLGRWPGEWPQCPICRAAFPPIPVRNHTLEAIVKQHYELGKQQFYCRNLNCEFLGNKDEMQAHNKECGYRKMRCVNAAGRCAGVFIANEMKEHESKCAARKKMDCFLTGCGARVSRSLMDDHFKDAHPDLVCVRASELNLQELLSRPRPASAHFLMWQQHTELPFYVRIRVTGSLLYFCITADLDNARIKAVCNVQVTKKQKEVKGVDAVRDFPNVPVGDLGSKKMSQLQSMLVGAYKDKGKYEYILRVASFTRKRWL